MRAGDDGEGGWTLAAAGVVDLERGNGRSPRRAFDDGAGDEARGGWLGVGG